MQPPNLVASAAVFGCNESTSPIHAPGISCASTAWWSGPTVNGPLDQYFPDDSSYCPEFLTAQNSGHQYHVNDDTAFRSIYENPMLSHSETTDDGTFFYPQDPWYLNDDTAFRSIPGNPILSHSETADDRTFFYPQDPWCPPPEVDGLIQAYIWSQCGLPLWYTSSEFPPSLQAMTSQPSTEPLFIMIPPQEQSALPKCAWTEDGKQCGHPLLDDTQELGDVAMHLRDYHGIQGDEKKEVTCLWKGCNQKLQRCAILRHTRSRHLKIRWTCMNCFKKYSRKSTLMNHVKVCQAAEAGPLTTSITCSRSFSYSSFQ